MRREDVQGHNVWHLTHAHDDSGQLLLGGDWGGDKGDEEGGISGSQRVLKVRVLMTERDTQEFEFG